MFDLGNIIKWNNDYFYLKDYVKILLRINYTEIYEFLFNFLISKYVFI